MNLKAIALIAHDNKKRTLANWVCAHFDVLRWLPIVSTETTGTTIREKAALENLRLVKSGPLDGDQQIGAMIAQEEISLLVFFTDPMTPHPHDVDVKALTRLATVYDVPMACSPATADLIIASGYLSEGVQ